MKHLAASLILRFRASERGAVLVEALVVIPVITLLAVGLLEFGVMFWERQQMQAGVRDAARYLSRCNTSADFLNGATAPCGQAVAQNIAFYGAPTATGGLRVPNWFRPDDLRLTVTADQVLAEGRLLYAGSPLFALLQLEPITIRYRYAMGYMGW